MADPLTLIHGDALSSLRTLEDGSVQCCVTSPPYWGLRDYGTGKWEGGDSDCDHVSRAQVSQKAASNRGALRDGPYKGECGKCGASRVDIQIGLEKTPEEYVARLVEVFREIRRVLRGDGTLWLNLADSYAGGGRGGNPDESPYRKQATNAGSVMGATKNPWPVPTSCKPKDLVGIPWAVAKALRDPYYAGRIKAECDRAWMAAMIDGEGTICGFKHDRKDDGRQRTGINICVTNANTALLDECYRIWPTSRKEHNTHGEGHYGSLPVYRWIVHGTTNKILFLREIYPYLIGKRLQALLAYNLLLFSLDAKRLGKTPQKDATNAKRARLAELISDANNYRPFDIPDWCVEPPSVVEQGWYLRSDIIWSKPNPMPESITDRPTKSHEYIFLLSKSERYYYDAEAIAEPNQQIERPHFDGKRGLLPKGSYQGVDRCGNGRGGRNSFRGQGQTRPEGNGQANRDGRDMKEIGAGLTRNKRSVWTVTTRPFPDAHFATFPIEIPSLCILAGSKPGDVVIDPFAGSGTTGKVAIELGRKAILIEPKAEYVEMIKRRCQTTIGLPLAI